MRAGIITDETPMSYTNQVDHANSSTADTVVTGVGFAPRAVMLFTADASGGAGYASISGADENGNGRGILPNRLGVANSWFRCGAVFLYETGANYTSGAITMDSDGFTIAWTKTGSPTDTARIGYTCLR